MVSLKNEDYPEKELLEHQAIKDFQAMDIEKVLKKYAKSYQDLAKDTIHLQSLLQHFRIIPAAPDQKAHGKN